MTLSELLKNEIFELPLKQPKDESFNTFIIGRLNLFLSLVNNLKDEEILGYNDSVDLEFIKRVQTKVIQNLINCINEYYNGNPFKAYENLNSVLLNDYKDLYSILKQKEYDVNESFFRIRLSENHYPFKRNEMFHIPFELRNKVSTQRYSIPGFPSLYLGRTIYVCWEELSRPSVEKIQAVKLKNVKQIKLLDLTPPKSNENNKKEIYRFFMTFPLIMCCSVKVRNQSDTFKPEYIIPQLLLQWIRNNDRILDGIQYKSTHISSKDFTENSELINIVLPVKTNNKSGLCTKLVKYFESTESISWNLLEIASGGETYLYNKEEAELINKKIPFLGIVEGKKYPYFGSILGKLEYYLESSKTLPFE